MILAVVVVAVVVVAVVAVVVVVNSTFEAFVTSVEIDNKYFKPFSFFSMVQSRNKKSASIIAGAVPS